VKILLVENEADIARLVSYVLVSQGFAVEQVFDAAEAELKLAHEKFDVMLLDLMLPGEDGYSFCKRIKGEEAYKDLTIIIISARVMPNEIKRALDCGASGYITKPYNPMTLGKDIRRIYSEAQKKTGPP
jgi:DNA-binding response OmpR family regulator